MKAIDTNLLIRLITLDDKKQADKVFELMKKAELKKEILFIPSIVVLEMIWVLGYSYDVCRKDIIRAVKNIMLLPILKFEHYNAVHKFILSAEMNNLDLADILIGFISKECGCETVLTFDNKAAKSDLFELVK
ncbi:MAG: type II toxin-antitoxin system VapC family toxin [Candidatus Delongbacteria bacterium]